MRVFYAFLVLAFLSLDSIAQKKPLDHTVYDDWQNISATAISKKGEYIFYSVSPQEGDNQLFLKTNKNETVFSLPRASKPQFSIDEKHFVSLISPFFKDLRQAKIDKKKQDEMPNDSLAIYSFANKSWVKFPNVKSYKLAEENGKHLIYLFDDIPEKKPKRDSLESKSTKETADSLEVNKEKPKKPTTDLVIYQLGVGRDTLFKNVEDYEIDKLGNHVVFSRKSEEKDSTGTIGGVFRYDLKTKQLVHLISGKGTFKNFTFDESGKQLAFLADKSAENALLKDYKVYYHTENSVDSAKVLVSANTSGVPQKWYVSGDGNLKFSKNGGRLFLGLAPVPRVKDTTLVDFENAKVDIWHWQDDYLQTQQLVNLKRDLSKNYLAVLDLSTPDKVLPLADESLPDTRTTEGMDEEFILATTDLGRRIETQWRTGSFQDVYLVSTKDGSRKLVTKDLRGNIILSPEGKYLLWYNRENQNWYSHSIATGNTVQLNKDLAVSFADEDNDSPDTPGSYGVSGWTANDEKVYIYDKFDIWSFKTDGTQTVKLTSGRDSKTTYRYSDWVERKGRFAPTIIDEKKPLILNTFNNVSKENGFARLTLQTGKKAPKEPFKEVVLAKTFFGQIKEAKDGGAYIYSKENYKDSPDLYFSKDFVTETKLSSINQQQTSYNWGTAELFKWTTPKGHAAEGILYKPEDFDPNKTYPIIAYFYEKLSDGLYRYQAPAPTPSRLNISYFVSNGYVVLAPDIVYEIGHPGKSAEEYINSGMTELKKNKWAGKLGIQGQSWGGYQVAHLITATDMYDAAWSGAPVVNMTSAYGGIRWKTGMNRQFQYERTQSRIGATLWEKPELYIENSPLFHLPKVKTPVVIMHNDEDGAVPWYQGIEMFTALRRLQKPVWMLNYNGDAHNLVHRQNRKDIQRRQQQFFDHYLKGKPAAPWIEKGVPATLKGIDWGFGE